MAIGRVIRQLRQGRDWSQQDLADHSGVSRSYITQIEAGDRPSPSAVILGKLADALGVSLDYLLAKAEGKGIDDEDGETIRALYWRLDQSRRRILRDIAETLYAIQREEAHGNAEEQ